MKALRINNQYVIHQFCHQFDITKFSNQPYLVLLDHYQIQAQHFVQLPKQT